MLAVVLLEIVKKILGIEKRLLSNVLIQDGVEDKLKI
jgi:hypothetical protein